MIKIGPITPATPFDDILPELKEELKVELRSLSKRIFGQPDANFFTHAEYYEVEIAVPGLEKSDLGVSVKKKQLVVSAKTKRLLIGDSGAPPRYLFREFGFSGFERRFDLPEDAVLDNITARCDRGVLVVSVPRFKEEGKSLNIKID